MYDTDVSDLTFHCTIRCSCGGAASVWRRPYATNRSAVNGMGVVDAQGVRHLGAPTLGEQGESTGTVSGMQAVSRYTKTAQATSPKP
jgi:hypothetical protein